MFKEIIAIAFGVFMGNLVWESVCRIFNNYEMKRYIRAKEREDKLNRENERRKNY